MPPQNRAAWLMSKKQYPLEVKDAPYPEPKDNEVIIKVHYVAMNPADWKMIKWGYRITEFPAVIGQDVAGEVVQAGKSVKHVKQGDRVVALTLGVTVQDPSQGAFQLYTKAHEAGVSLVPDGISLDQAVVLPLAFTTATVGLFTAPQLGLATPPLSNPEKRDQVVLLWGGSSSVGTVVIQLAKAAGYKVAVTCSPRNNDLVKSIGADFVFDYSSKDVVADIVTGLKGQDVVGAFNVIGGEESGNALVEILSQVSSSNKEKHIATVPLPPTKEKEGVKAAVLGSAAEIFIDEKRQPIAHYMWHEFLPEALKSGLLKPTPEPMLVGEGLESVQKALDTLEAGVSAKKVIVKLA